MKDYTGCDTISILIENNGDKSIGFTSKKDSGHLLSHGSGGELLDGDIILIDSDCSISLASGRWINVESDGKIKFQTKNGIIKIQIIRK